MIFAGERMKARNTLEHRVASLEQAVDELRGRDKLPWWRSIAGSFAGDATFTEAMKLGRDYRTSTRSSQRSKRHVHP